jgi:hypothetical protein
MPEWEGRQYGYDDKGYSDLLSDMLQHISTSSQVMSNTGDLSFVQNTDLKKFQSGINQLSDYLGIEPIALSGEWDSETTAAFTKFSAAAKMLLPTQPPGEVLGENEIMGSEIAEMSSGSGY